MRTDKLFIGALAILFTGLASCSNEEPAGNSGNTDDSKDGRKYMAVTISSSGMGGNGRAELPAFETGAGSESKFDASDVTFLFFDENGYAFPLAAANVAGTTVSNAVTPTSIAGKDQPTGMLVLGKAVGEGYVGKTPTQALCLINTEGIFTINDLANKPMSRVLEMVASYPAGGFDGATTKFLMTNSIYVSDGKVVESVSLDGKFYDTPTEAEGNPANFYMERVVAKVRVSGLSQFDAEVRNAEGVVDGSSYLINNEPVDLKVRLTGWKLRNTAAQTAAFKEIEADGDYFSGWNDANNYRCYWALSNTGSVENTEYNISDTDQNPTDVNIGEWSEANPVENVAYCFENTTHAGDGMTTNDRSQSTTAIVVRAVVEAESSPGVYTPVDLIRWAGAYYTLEHFKGLVATNYNNTHAGADATADNVVIKLTDGNYYQAYVNYNSAETPMDIFKDLLWWVNGETSYYANIEHTPGSTTEKKCYGVVRNHIYQYVFDGVIGLGIPGNDPIPPVETETFLSAKVYCLDWRIVGNRITLE